MQRYSRFLMELILSPTRGQLLSLINKNKGRNHATKTAQETFTLPFATYSLYTKDLI